MGEQDLVKSIIAGGSVPIILALVQVIKGLVPDSRWYPLVAVAFGLLINVGCIWALNPSLSALILVYAVIQGLMAGLSASGIYSAGSTLKEGGS
jgi:hypothetical protein